MAVREPAIDKADGVNLGFHHQLHVGSPEDILHEHIFDAFFLEPKLRHKLITTFERHLELHVEPCHYGINTSRVEVGETHIVSQQELMPGVLNVMLVVGIVHNPLEVAFVVAYFQPQLKDIVCHLCLLFIFFSEVSVFLSNNVNKTF